jgi:DNA repair protein RAD50
MIQKQEKFKMELETKNKIEIAAVEGNQVSLSKNLESLSVKLDQNSDVESKYFQDMAYFEYYRSMCQDLDIFRSLMERALLKFHAEKMEEVNSTIAEIWKQTYSYCHKDIKTIEIQTDAQIETDDDCYGKTRFNYRIVYLNNNGKELDMRGRSSMGQKVLASIVIRLALAEAFATNCGILTLDEPTTNLDKANIERLAKFLIDLIEMKRGNDCFQLVIISHDREFVGLLNEYSDYYFKVAKDEEGYSRIEHRDIDEINN